MKKLIAVALAAVSLSSFAAWEYGLLSDRAGGAHIFQCFVSIP